MEVNSMFCEKIMNRVFFSLLFSSFLGLSAMDQGASSSCLANGPTVQSVFGHRLRLKNYTNTPLVVNVEKADGVFWSARVDVHRSIDLGSIHDKYVDVEVYKYPFDVFSDPEVRIPVQEIIKQFQNIPETSMVSCVINKSGGTHSYRVEEAACEKNTFNPTLTTPILHQVFPALGGRGMDSLPYRGDIEAFRKYNPFKFYQCVLGLNCAFSKNDVIVRADRLVQEWDPKFYDDPDQIKTIQFYIELAKLNLVNMLQAEIEQEDFKRSSDQTSHIASSSAQTCQTEEDDLCMRLLPFALDESRSAPKASKVFDEPYFENLLKGIKQGVSIYEEQRYFTPEHNEALISLFRDTQPIISFQDLNELITRCIENFEKQLYFSVNDRASYVQTRLITPENSVNIIGDIHGSIHSLIRIFEDALRNKTGNTKYVFLGDYADRGLFGAEVFALLMCFKLANWENVFLLRGNHECYGMNLDRGCGIPGSILSFKAELEAKYGLEKGNKLLLQFNELYKRLPLALYMRTNKDGCVQFCHAGFHPGLNPKDYNFHERSLQGVCFTDDYTSGYFNGFVWGDFYQRDGKIVQDLSGRGTELAKYIPIIDNVMSINPSTRPVECSGIKAVFRGHQHSGCGFKMFPATMHESAKLYETELGLAPMPWDLVVGASPDGAQRDSDGRWKLKISHYIPIFTFSAATELGVTNETYYGILQPAEKFEDWTLKPVCLE
jgi:hypothetical protein